MTTALFWVHAIGGLVVLAEALNKLQRTAPHAPGLTPHQRLVDAMKAVAWLLLALFGGGAVARPFLNLPPPDFYAVCGLSGFTVLIVRTRLKEG